MRISDELLIELVDAAMSADYVRVRRAGNRIARVLEQSEQQNAARTLRTILRKRGMPLQASGVSEALPVDSVSRIPLLEEQDPPSSPLFANEHVHAVLRRFLEDARHVDLLSEKGLPPRLSLVLSGPPGTGKSLLAGHLAESLGKPLFLARLDSLISSRLGETAKNIRGIFDFVPAKNAVLFLDELDAIAKLRDDRHELGELKRVVNTVLQGMDSLDSHSIVVAATNHSHLLDSAIWRRFPYKIDMDLPDSDARTALWHYFLYEDDPEHQRYAHVLSAISEGMSGADIENLAFLVRRQSVLEDSTINSATIAWTVFASRQKSSCHPPQSLGAEQKRRLAIALSDVTGVRMIEIAEFLGVSRQMVARYIKDHRNA